MNEIHDRYAVKGFQVLAISCEPRSVIEEYVQKTGAKHPIAVVEESMLDGLGVRGYPTSYLIGPDGRVLWKDHPARLTDAMIEEHLEKVRTLPDLSKFLAAVGKAIEKDKMAEALLKVEKLLEAEDLDETQRAEAEKVRDWVLWRGTSSVEGAAKDLEGGRAYEAWLGYDWVASAFKGHDLGRDAEAVAKELLADKDHKREIDAGKRLDKALVQIRDMSPKKAIKILAPIVKKYEGTRAGARAAERLKALEKED